MLSPNLSDEALLHLEGVLCSCERRAPILQPPPRFSLPIEAMSLRDAIFSPFEEIPVQESEGRVLAHASVGCPPAVPIAVCGEIIDRAALEAFAYYGIQSCRVVVK